jgi:hypothetical protein
MSPIDKNVEMKFFGMHCLQCHSRQRNAFGENIRGLRTDESQIEDEQ